MKFDLFLLGFGKVIKQEISAFRGQFLQAFIQTLAGETLWRRSVRGDFEFVNIQMGSFFPQRFPIDVFSNAETVGELVFDFLGGAFEDQAVDGFIREIVGKVAMSQ